MNMNHKNSLTILNGLLISRGGAKFEMLQQSGPIHAPIYEFSAYFKCISAIGSGGSKQCAKQQAAENLLKEFNVYLPKE